ncbi:MAG: hypothetical protein AAFS10_27695 [Myxococcota bacterium]
MKSTPPRTLFHASAVACAVFVLSFGCTNCSSDHTQRDVVATESDTHPPAPSAPPPQERYIRVASHLGCLALRGDVEDMGSERRRVLSKEGMDNTMYLKLAQQFAADPDIQAQLNRHLERCSALK